MNIEKAKDAEADFQGFLTLDREFNQAYDALQIGEHYGRITADQIDPEEYRIDFNAHLVQPRSCFLFAKDDERYVGYLFGSIEAVNDGYHTYRMDEVGHIESLAVAPEAQGHGVSSRLRDAFFEWLRSEGVSLCRITVKTKNEKAMNIYRHWGFEADEVTMWKRLS